MLNAAFAPVFGEGFQPLVPGASARPRARRTLELRLFDPDPPAGAPPVELLVTDTRGWDEHAAELGLGALAEQPWRRAPRRGCRAPPARGGPTPAAGPATSSCSCARPRSLRLFEQALEEQGLPTYVVGGRGYWSQEQVRDGLAYLAALANPRDEDGALRRRSPRRSAASAATRWCCSPRRAATAAAAVGRARAPRRSPAGTASAGVPWPPRGRRGRRGDGSRRAAWLDAVPADDRRGCCASRRFFAAERARAERLPRRGAARARDHGHGLRPRDPRARRRRAAAGEPAQAHAAGARVRARGGPRPARLPRLRGRRRTSRRRARARRRSSPRGSTPCG